MSIFKFGITPSSIAAEKKMNERRYPSEHGPGSSIEATLAWALVDRAFHPQVPPLTYEQRCLMAGLFAGALSDPELLAKLSRGKRKGDK